tara:strand:- start:2377 stop:2760 length:384 start_codon:yes stop_codon:yes gene_type:complete
MANLTTRIGGQHYYKAATGNNESLLNFWKGTQAQYDAEKQTSATTSGNPSGASTVTFTVTSSSIFTPGATVFVTGTSGNTTRTEGAVTAVPSGTTVTVSFTPAYTSAAASGYQIDIYDPNTFYIITA